MATLATNVSFQCFGLDGKPLAGGKVYTYSAGTTTSKATYTTMQGDVPNTNPVILDQNGKAKIFLGDGSYRLQIKDSSDALIDDIDQISRYVTQSEFASFQQTVSDGVTQLTEVREQIDVFVNTSIGNQKGFANGIAPLDPNVKINPIYLDVLPTATSAKAGAVKLDNTLTSTATDAALTAAQGKVLNDRLVGFKQPVDVTSLRIRGATYTNTDIYPRLISINLNNTEGGSTSSSIIVDDVIWGQCSNNIGYGQLKQLFAIVRPGGKYRLDSPNVSVQTWIEA